MFLFLGIMYWKKLENIDKGLLNVSEFEEGGGDSEHGAKDEKATLCSREFYADTYQQESCAGFSNSKVKC